MAIPTVQSAIYSQNEGALAEQLDQQGRSHYAAGQFTEAVAAFQQAAEAYQAQGGSLKQAIALSNLSLANQQLGLWAEATQAIDNSLALLAANLPAPTDRQSALAQALDIQGTLHLSQGNAQYAFESWQQAATLYRQLGSQSRLTQSQINQSQALQTLGLYRRAIDTLVMLLDWQPHILTTLETLQARLSSLPDEPVTIAILQSLGEALRVTGNLAAARAILQQSWERASRSQQPDTIAMAQFRLANLTWTEALVNLRRSNLTSAQAVQLVQQAESGDQRLGIDSAEVFYQASNQALALYREAATAPRTQLQAQLNQLRVLVETARQAEIQSLLPQLQQQIDRLPPSRTAMNARINLAQTLLKLNERQNAPAVAQLLATASQQAKALQDPITESQALGHLGEMYEQTGQLQEAQQVTRQALLLAQSYNAPNVAYQWQWQLGRLLKAEAEGTNSAAYREAIAAYTEAVNTLKSIRGELIAITPEEQLSFREAIEPVYRQLVALLLSQSDAPNGQSLQAARDVIESLQLAELDNFFREACLNGDPTLIDQVDQTAAIFYPIVLPDQLAVVISLPNGDLSQSGLQYYATSVSQAELEATVALLRDSLDQANDNRFLQPAQQIYDWLIRPIQAQLASSQVDTLVFILDGVLRNIPMAVLHDGQQFLAEQPYSLAVSPGLQLLGSQPLTFDRLNSALLAGITEARAGFSALPSVRDELEQIQTEIPKSVTLLDSQASTQEGGLNINGAFTNGNFQREIQRTPFPIVHLATHGQFSSQVEETYILTEDGRLGIEDLKNSLQLTAIRQQGAVELLVLSACETATGDDRAALGMAGVAVRAGARSTVATLWQVNDASSANFMGEFYRELVGGKEVPMTKAAALRQAQLSLLHHPDYHHPYFWAPYVLIGNWQ
ncbi:CHAT domain-containing protein [Phormidium tenue FACHB-886]|nr:CHAT domain-containing protein [Phormidium tenue FACHB-886]